MPTIPGHPLTHDDAAAATTVAGQPARHNRLLRALSPDVLARLQPHMERVHVPLLEVLCEPRVPFTHVYFPETGVISIVNRLSDGSEVEVGTIGNEGMAGLSAVLDSESIPSVTLMEIPGEVLRVPVDVVVALAEERPEVRRMLHRYAQAFMIQIAQTASCNRSHEIYERCARWMCMAHDRMGGASHFLLTQHVLAQMLGVRRAGVSVAASMLQRAGFIRYSRGRVTILDLPGLEGASCECHAVVKGEFDRLLGAG